MSALSVIHDFRQRHETAKKISRRQQIGQKINLQLRRVGFRAVVWRGWHKTYSHLSVAITVSPPTTRSPSLTLISAVSGRYRVRPRTKLDQT